MSEKLYGRRCVVRVDTLEVDGLRVVFKVHKDHGSKPNTAEIAITNLAEKTRAAMQKKGAKVQLSAGYTDNVAVIFSGDARTIDHVREGSNWITKIACGDGEVAYRFARISEAFGKGALVKDVILKSVGKLGLDQGNAPEKLAGLSAQFVNGYSAHGKVSAELDTLLASHGYGWSIQDGRVQVLKEDETTKESAVFLSESTGLIGSPEHGTSEKKNGRGVVKLRSLLQPRIKPGGKLEVDSEGVKGRLRVVSLDHRGDTHGGDWYSDVEAVSIG